MSRIRRGSLAVLSLGSAACSPQSTLWPAGPAAAGIARLTWFLLWLAAVVFVAVLIVLGMAVVRNRRRELTVDLTRHSTRFVAIGGAILPGIVLITIFVVGTSMMGAFPTPTPGGQLTIHVTGRQWWWQVDYDYPELQQRFTTANELHIPVGIPVKVYLTSADVIHSFWVPRLQGKLDVIPGDTNDIRLLASNPGTYRGQCAEFCGLQHAHMAITVVADPPAEFKAWATGQLAPARQPTDSLALLGQQLVVSGPCAVCHTVRGTSALGTVGPDLTHVGSRQTIAAGLMPNTLATLEGWIANAQALKPGVKMPPITQFTGTELRAVATYISSLK
jgi:cytochrome c oxidase subunit II